MDMIKIGKFIAELRKENGYTQEQLAEKLGVTGKTVSRWETGTYLPPIEKLQQISILYSVSMNDILNGEQIGSEEYPQKADENLVAVIENEKRASAKRDFAFLAGITAFLLTMFAVIYFAVDFASMSDREFRTTAIGVIFVLAAISLLTIWIRQLRNNKMYLALFILSVVICVMWLTWIVVRKYYSGFFAAPTLVFAMYTSYKAYREAKVKKETAENEKA